MPDLPSPGVFLSYRREDSAPYARLLQFQLRERIPGAPIFMDMDSIEPGLDFAVVIAEAVRSCAVLIALIGRHWSTLTDGQGRRRLDDPDDYVRFEVETALDCGVRVIPVLVDGAEPLRQQQLPAGLARLARLNALDVSYGRYEYDANRLLDLVERVLAQHALAHPAVSANRDVPIDLHDSNPANDADPAQISQLPGGWSGSTSSRGRKFSWVKSLQTASLIAMLVGLGVLTLSGDRGSAHAERRVAGRTSRRGDSSTPGVERGNPLPAPLLGTLASPRSVFKVLAFSPNSQFLAVASNAGAGAAAIYLWNITTRTITTTLTSRSTAEVSSVDFSPDGTTLAVGDDNGKIYLWNTATHTITATFRDPTVNGYVGIESVAFSPDGTTLAVADYNGRAYLWKTATRSITATIYTPIANVAESVAFSADGTTLAVGDDNGKTYLWNTATHAISATLGDPRSRGVGSVAFSPNGTTLAVGDHNGKTYLWNTATHAISATLRDPSSEGAGSVAFSADGTTLAVGDANGKTYLWNMATHTLTGTLSEPLNGEVNSVAFSPDGTTLATNSTFDDFDGRDNFDYASTYLWNTTIRPMIKITE